MTTSEMERHSARDMVVGVVTWWGLDLEDVVEDDGLLENSWMAGSQHGLPGQSGDNQGMNGHTVNVNRQDSSSIVRQKRSQWTTDDF